MFKDKPYRIVVILSRPPLSIGNGGNHRSYQLIHDLQNGPSNIEVIMIPAQQIQLGMLDKKNGYSFYDYQIEFKERAKLIGKALHLRFSPYRLLDYLLYHYSKLNNQFPFDKKAYIDLLDRHSPIDLCILDHTVFIEIVSINTERGIPTWVCPQNLETFDKYALAASRQKTLTPFSINLQRELNTLTRCKERLVISRPEAWLLDGLDIPAHLYPYIPVGAIRNNLLEIRDKREKLTIDGKLFLMIGTGEHKTTAQGFDWFLMNLCKNTLPEDIKILVVGKGTENFRDKYQEIKGLEFRGWVESDELTELLCTSKAILIPQLTGFGALTRIPELACAGIPLIVSEHAAQSIDLPPQVTILPNWWSAWREAIEKVSNDYWSILPDRSSFLQWEARQPNPLKTLLVQYANSS